MSGPLVLGHFSRADLERIKATVREAESRTSGEIRVKVVERCDEDLKGNLVQQALRDFEREGLHNTRDKTGVLVLVVLGEKRFRIIGDSGIHEKLPQSYWNDLARKLSILFVAGDFTGGICRVVSDIGKELASFFPHRADDKNELSDDVIIGGRR